MQIKTRSFQTGEGGYIQQWLTAGLFADLLVPASPPREGEETAGERWTFAFSRHRAVVVPGYRSRRGMWWLAACCLQASEERRPRLVLGAPAGSYLGTEGRGFQPLESGPFELHLTPRPSLIVVAVPAGELPDSFSARLEGVPEDAAEVVHLLDTAQPVRLGRVAARDVWVDYRGEPRPTVWIEALNITGRPVRLRLHLETDDGEETLPLDQSLPPLQAELLEVPYSPDLPAGRARLSVHAHKARTEREVTLAHTSHDWEVHVVPHFHFDPVGCGTQVVQLERAARAAFPLVHRYLDAAADPSFTFALGEVPYTKPYWDTFPSRREHLVELARTRRLALTGALYNEPQTTLIGPEATARNICYGTFFHRRLLGVASLDGWLLDVSGHDPNFPSLFAHAGQTSIAYARGPYKRCWGIPANRLSFPVDYWWVAPDGSRLLARLLEPGSYSLGHGLERYDGPEEAWWEVAELFEAAGDYPAAHLEMWTLGGDLAPPVSWLGELSRLWNARHLSPKLFLSRPGRFFAALADQAASGRALLPAMTRDLNPVNNGSAVSCVDGKLANRLCERLIAEGEAVAAVASTLVGAPYPEGVLDYAWRQLLFNAHHDAISGCGSDQVYVDITGGWREAYEAARDALAGALARLVSPARGRLTVFNPLPWRRDDVVEVELVEGWAWDARVLDGDREVPAEVVAQGARKLLRFVARDVPGLGARAFRVEPGRTSAAPDLMGDVLTIENEFFRVEMDPLRGGGIVGLTDKRTGRELVQADRVANDLVAHRESPELPGHGEGPRHICTTGEKHYASAEFPAEVSLQRTPVRLTLAARSDHVGCRRDMRVTLWAGLPRVDFETRLLDYGGADWLFKVHFPLAIEGGRPVYEVGGPVVSRTYCPGDQDTREMPWTQDSAANHYVDLAVPLRLAGTVGIGGEVLGAQSLGMAEIVCPSDRSMAPEGPIGQLLLALSSHGVSATVTWPEFRRFGDLAWDSNVPDFRLVIGQPSENAFTRHLVSQAGGVTEAELREWTANHGWAVALFPSLKLGLPAEVPVVIVWAEDPDTEAEAVEHIAAQIRELGQIVGLVPSALRSTVPDGRPSDGGVALLNRGTVSYCCYPDQTLTLALMRSCTGWPSGHWVDEPARSCPDGSSFQLEHWAHRFEYSLVSHDGHWRDSGLARRGYEYNRPLLAVWGEPRADGVEGDLLLLEPDSVVMTALKPAGANVGHPLDAQPTGRGLIVRVQETGGRPAEARLRTRLPVRAAWKCNLLEEPDSQLEVDDGQVLLPLGQFETATVLLETAAAGPAFHRADVPTEPPAYARWWRYNPGAAPPGFLPATVLFDVDEPLRSAPGGEVSVGLTIAAGYLFDEALVCLAIEGPPGWGVDDDGYETRLSFGGYEVRNVRLHVPADAPPGQYLVTATVTPPFGPPVSDFLHIAVGEEPSALVEAELGPAQVDVGVGGACLRVRVRNLSRSRVSGHVLLVSPAGAWELYDHAVQPVSLSPQGEATVEYPLRGPTCDLEGWSWALAKVMVAGQLLYTEAVRLDL